MSDALATATTLLQQLLSEVTPTVTARSPGSARKGETGEQLNVFLYSVNHDPAMRNHPAHTDPGSGNHISTSLPRVLRYLITAYGSDDDEISEQRLMGKVIALLHQHPILGPSEEEESAYGSGTQQRKERMVITQEPLSLDQLAKLWNTFQSAEYRLSVSYQVSGVLIESSRGSGSE